MLDLRSGGKTDYVMASRRDDQYIVRVSNVRLPSPTAELIDSYAVASRVTYSQIILFDALQQHGSTRRTSLPYPLGLDESSSTSPRPVSLPKASLRPSPTVGGQGGRRRLAVSRSLRVWVRIWEFGLQMLPWPSDQGF